MVGKNNRQKLVNSNLKERYKSYKVGKNWVFASIASLTLGAALFFGVGTTAFADSDTSTDATATTTQTVTAPSEDGADATSTAQASSTDDAQKTAAATTNQSATANADTTPATGDSTVTATKAAAVTKSTTATNGATSGNATINKADSDNTADSTAVTTQQNDSQTASSQTATSQATTAKTDTSVDHAADATTDAANSTNQDAATSTAFTATSLDKLDGAIAPEMLNTKIAAAKAAANILHLGDASALTLEQMKALAAKQFQATGEPQLMTAMDAEGSVSISTNTTQVGYGSNFSKDKLVTSIGLANFKAGDIVTVTLPTNLDLLYLTNPDTNFTSLGTYGTTTYLKNADGTVTVTDTFTKDADAGQTYTQTLSIGVANNNWTVPGISPDQSGKTVTGNITTTYNGVAGDYVTISQTTKPSVAIKTAPTRSNPDSNTIAAILPNTDYVYELHVNDSTGNINDWGTQRVNRLMNTGGTTITVPVPSSFTLNADLTSQLNAFNDGTTITQSATGADIIITVPAGSGEINSYSTYPYYLAGSYNVTQTSSPQTVSAAGPATVTQNAPSGTLTATVVGNAVWTDTIQAQSTPDSDAVATVTNDGNSSGNTSQLALDTTTQNDPKYINTVHIQTNSASDETNAKITINFPDGVKGTGVILPNENAAQTNSSLTSMPYLPGTTSYQYTITYADGTTSTGTAAAGSEIDADHDSAIRSIVLTPNYLAAGAGKLTFRLLGNVSEKYDNGSSVNNGDTLSFKTTVQMSPQSEIVTGQKDQKVVTAVGLVTLYVYSGTSLPNSGSGQYLGISYNGVSGQTTDLIYEPILYIVAPNNAPVTKVNIPAADLAAGVKVTTYATNDGRVGYKFDYTGTGLYVDTAKGSGTYGLVFGDNYSDLLPGKYPIDLYITSPTTPLSNSTKVTNTSLTDGDANALLAGSSGFTISAMAAGGATSYVQGNTDLIPGSGTGTSNVADENSQSFYVTVTNGQTAALDSAIDYVNLPTVGDTQGSQYNFNLTGPLSLPASLIKGDSTTVPLDSAANIKYSTKLYDPDTSVASDYVSADQITDWSTVRSVKFDFGSVAPQTSTGKVAITGEIQDFVQQVGKTGTLGAYFSLNGAKPSATKAPSLKVIGISTVKVAYHYVDDAGNDQYIYLPEKDKTYNDGTDTMPRSDFPVSQSDLTTAELQQIPSGYALDKDAAGNLVVGITNSDKTYSGGANDAAAFDQTVQYYFDSDIVTINLKSTKVSVPVQYVDDVTGQVVKTDTITGHIGDIGNYQADLTDLPNYEVDTNDAVIPYVLDTGKTLTVHLTHQMSDTDTVTTTQTVHYYITGTTTDLAPATTQTITWKIIKDTVNGNSFYIPEAGYNATTAKYIAGYTPSTYEIAAQYPGAKIGKLGVPTSTDEVIYYTPTQQMIPVTFWDDVTNSQVGTDQITGTTGTTGNYEPGTRIPAGYKLVNASDASIAYTMTATPQSLTIHLTHIIDKTQLTTTRTVYFVDQNGKQLADPVNQVLTWNISTDEVTGRSVAIPVGNYPAVPAKSVTGYTATTTGAPADGLYPTMAENVHSSKVYVVYNVNSSNDSGNDSDATSGNTTESGGGTTTGPTTTVNEPGGTVKETGNSGKTGQSGQSTSGETGKAGSVNGNGQSGISSQNDMSTQSGANAKTNAKALPQTSESNANQIAWIGLGMFGVLSLMGLAKRKKREE